MRILLIRPASSIKAVPMPLGLGYLSAALKKRGHEVSVLDARLHRLDAGQVRVRVREYGPDAVGISALSFDAEQAHELARAIKEEFSYVPVILGGPYASARGEAILEDRAIDVLVPGEGEETLPELLGALGHHQPLRDVKGIIFREADEVVRTGPRPAITDLDAYGVDWAGLNPAGYFSLRKRTAQNSIQYGSRVASLFTSRGCPFGCIYCHNIFGRKLRTRSPESVISEMELLVREYGITEFEIADDAFNLDLARAKTIARGIVERGLKVHLAFPNGFRADRVDVELLDLLRAAGTFRINYAVESASPRIQKMIGKALDLDKARESISMTAGKGIVTAGYFMIGFPGETAQEMRMTADFAVNSDLHIASFFYLCPFPGTPLVESRPEIAERVRNLKFEDYTEITVNLSAVSDAEMTAICKQAYRRFYFQPSRIIKTMMVVPKNFRTLVSVLDVIRLSIKDAVNY